jgi:poly-gamma-glutamate capsule biosynthesis protein CapA/YwtB (metallophosphatase superfamily)
VPLAAVLIVLLLGAAAMGIAVVRSGSGGATTADWSAGSGSKPSAAPVADPVSAAPAAAGQEITMSAVGDTIMSAAPTYLPPGGGRGFFDDVSSALHSDLQMANLEQPLTNDTGVSKCSAASLGKTCFQFRSPPSYANILKQAGFSLVNLANNHALDFGTAGHQQTEDALTAAGVKYTGPPGMITMVDVKGIKVAVLGFAPYPWANDLTNIPKAQALVRQAKQEADLVVIQVHMGGEGADHTHVKPGTETYLGENRGDPIGFSHAMIDAGADIVIGHSPHVLRAMEFYKGHLIAYSMGNFAGYHALSATGVLGVSGILRVTLRKDGTFVAGTLVPTRMVSPGVPRMDPGKQAITMVNGLSRSDFTQTGAHIAADGAITPS